MVPLPPGEGGRRPGEGSRQRHSYGPPGLTRHRIQRGGIIMKIVYIALMLILCVTSTAFAGNVYGSITDSGKPVAKGVKIEISCGDKKYNAETDENGSFKLFVPDKGKCGLKVAYQGETPSFDINSYDGS